MSSNVKQVKVDNWGTYFLQRLKHFFNRTDYCDLTLQFIDNAQLKVHRLVLSACTEYFELLESTCEMYEDCLIMPDDLQADVVVPIVNFMYTGHLEFQMDLLERLYQTSQTLNMPVLTKLLESHRNPNPKLTLTVPQKKYGKNSDKALNRPSTASTSNKRSYNKAFSSNEYMPKEKKVYQPVNKQDCININSTYSTQQYSNRNSIPTDPRPTRYELPEELDADNIFDSSFCNISYTSKPLVVHPETSKKKSQNKTVLYNEASSSHKVGELSTLDIVECKKISKDDSIFQDTMFEPTSLSDELDILPVQYTNLTDKDPNHLFDKMLDQNEGPKVTLETNDSKLASNIDHAKIISEVLKKYPHLVKSNKNIKLKILDTPTKPKKQQKSTSSYLVQKPLKIKTEITEEGADFTYESDVLDSKEAAKLIAMGAENINGPWICLICGTPGKALHFTSYYKFRRHLVEVHNEKPVSNICEYCGLKTIKRNYLHHHLYSQHGITPPPNYNFPKCDKCNYIALTEIYLARHKLTHKDAKSFSCNVCSMAFISSSLLLKHIQITGHKYTAERKKHSLQCVYCLRIFVREANLFAHLTTNHKKEAKRDGIIEDSDDEKPSVETSISYEIPEPSTSYGNESQFQIQAQPDGTHVMSIKQVIPNAKQKILNAGLSPSQSPKMSKPVINQPARNEFLADDIPLSDTIHEDIVMIDNNEYVMRESHLIPRQKSSKLSREEYIVSDIIEQSMQPSTSMNFASIHHDSTVEDQQSIVIKKSSNLGQPIQIVVSNEEEYKALMSSNHPIIFDDGDANKTVLTAPHETTLEPTTINLNETPSNNMMIIQDNYPMNVPVTATAANSNIVVLYSHPVDQNNKQYQIIATQGLGAQFVQSSAMITQNYETVTTSTPVMSAHVLNTQVQHTWPNNVPNIESQPIPVETNMDTIVQHENLEMATVQRNSIVIPHEAGLSSAEPENITSVVQQVVQDCQSNYSIESTKQVSEQNNVIDPHHFNDTPIETDIQIERIVEQEPSTNENGRPDEVILENANTNNSPDEINSKNNMNYEELPIHQENIFENKAVDENLEPNAPGQMEIVHDEHEGGNHPQEPEACIEPNGQKILQESQEYSVPIEDQQLVEESEESQNNSVSEDNQPHTEEAQEYSSTVKESQVFSEAIKESQICVEEPTATQECEESVGKLLETEGPKESFETTKTNPQDTKQDPHPKPVDTQNKEVVKEIQNLTSEWSEDEYDVPEDEPDLIEAELIQSDKTQKSEEQVEVEESIENIQQEVEKQMALTVDAKIKNLENLASLHKETDPKLDHLEKVVKETKDDPQHKISSLLNDWEDNDSQEDASANNSQDEAIPINNNENVSISDEGIKEPDESLTEPMDPKDDKIKKLVSDWDEDDDEEENK